MKKILLSLAFVLLLVPTIFSQDLHFGFQASPSFSWMRTDSKFISGSGSNTGLKLGVIAENRFSQAYAISTGIGFHFNSGGRLQLETPTKYWTKSRSEFSPTVPDSVAFAKESRFRYNLTYVEIPIGLKMRTAESGSHIRYFAEPMITLGFLSNARGSFVGTGKYDQDKIPIKDEVAGLNLSWGIGGGGEYIISNNTAIVIGMYFQRGFVDQTSDNGTLFDADGISNARKENSKGVVNSLTIRLGVMF
jgi:hypothetical protein